MAGAGPIHRCVRAWLWRLATLLADREMSRGESGRFG
jgi:hypothetical protein